MAHIYIIEPDGASFKQPTGGPILFHICHMARRPEPRPVSLSIIAIKGEFVTHHTITT